MNTESEKTELAILSRETDFAEFYFRIIPGLYDLKCRKILEGVRSALYKVRKLKKEADGERRVPCSYRDPADRCAYMFAYSVLHSLMVYSEFSWFLEQNKRFLFPAFRRDSLRLCCLGGGPGAEAVAICKSINDFVFETCGESFEPPLDIMVTMVDRLPLWEREVSNVIKAVNESCNVLHLKRANLLVDFMKADLLKPFEEGLKERIKEADIVTIVKFSRSIQGKNPEDCIEQLQNMMKNVIDSMDERSCLFMLDNAGGSMFNKMMQVARKETRTIPSLLRQHKEYSLDRKTLIKMEEILESKKHSSYSLTPTRIGKVSSCLWIKNFEQFEGKNRCLREGEKDADTTGNAHCSTSECEINENSLMSEDKDGISKAEEDAAEHLTLEKTGQPKESKKRSKKEKKKNFLPFNPFLPKYSQ